MGPLHDQLVERHEIRVRDVGKAPKFSLEAIHVGWPGVQQCFQGDHFVARPVVGFVNHPHAAGSQLPTYGKTLRATEFGTRPQRGQWRCGVHRIEQHAFGGGGDVAVNGVNGLAIETEERLDLGANSRSCAMPRVELLALPRGSIHELVEESDRLRLHGG